MYNTPQSVSVVDLCMLGVYLLGKTKRSLVVFGTFRNTQGVLCLNELELGLTETIGNDVIFL